MPDDKDLSGVAWFKANQSKFPNSTSVSDLDSSFKSSVKSFIDALEKAGAKVSVSTTKRDKTRAAVMHWAWYVAKGKTKPAKVPKIAGATINWDHGDDKKSVAAAKEMIGSKGFKIVHEPALTSRHIEGKAIDMTISWSKTLTIKNKKGDDVKIESSPSSGQNADLAAVGKTYGVIKLKSDPPHWSTDGK